MWYHIDGAQAPARRLASAGFLLTAFGNYVITSNQYNASNSKKFMKFSEAIIKFSAWRMLKVKEETNYTYSGTLRQFAIFMRDADIESITLDHVVEWLNLHRVVGYQDNTFIPKVMALRKFFEFFKRSGLNVVDPWFIPVPRTQFKIPRIATDENFSKLMAVIPLKSKDSRHVRNRAIVMLLWDTGARNSEICSLNVSDLDLEQRKAIIKTEKNRGSRPFREVFWNMETNEAVKDWILRRSKLALTMNLAEPDALFISISNIRSGKRMDKKGLGEMLRRYSNQAGIPPQNAHSFRHAFGHRIINNGGSSADVANLLGHASMDSSRIYTMMVDKELRERYEKFKAPQLCINLPIKIHQKTN